MKTWILLPALCLAQGVWAAETPNMQDGEWEITTRTLMPGMPMQVPPQTVRICISKQDIADGKKTMPSSMNDGKKQLRVRQSQFLGQQGQFQDGVFG